MAKKTENRKSAAVKKTGGKKAVSSAKKTESRKAAAAKSTTGKKKTTVKKKESQKKTSGKKKSDITFQKKLVIGAGIVAVLYVLLSVYFSSHFFLRTEINGYSCQFKTTGQVKEILNQNCEEFELVLKERGDIEESITSNQISLQFVDDGKIEDIQKSQKGFAWISAVFRKPVYENAVTITYDEAALINTVETLACLKEENMTAPKAAYPSFSQETGQFEIVEEELGALVDKDIFIEEIRNCLLTDQRIMDLNETECYVKPEFYSSDEAVTEAAALMNKYISTEITYDFGFTKVNVDKEQMSQWLVVDENLQVTVDSGKVGDFVEWLANNYNTCGIRRYFKTPEGTTVTVSGGTYGWRIHHQDEVARLCEDIKTGEKITREPEYKQTGYERDASGNDLHDTYIAIGIESQTMWYYKDGKCLLTTPVVTGNTSKKMGTPTGVYYIAFKQRNHVLRGEDYESPVDYWLPFYEYRGIGIHDASWRKEDQFGKEIYKTNGSHGCVNTPYQAVKTLFEMVETGTPVVVY